MNIINTPIKVSAEPNGARLVEVHQPLSEKIDDDPQLLPITLNSAMQSFKDAAQTDAEVMQHVMDVRSGMPVDVRRHQVSHKLCKARIKKSPRHGMSRGKNKQ